MVLNQNYFFMYLGREQADKRKNCLKGELFFSVRMYLPPEADNKRKKMIIGQPVLVKKSVTPTSKLVVSLKGGGVTLRF